MAVWTSAKARAATVGAGLVARTSASVCSSHLSTTLSLDEGPYWLKLNSDLGPFGIPDPGGGGGLEAAATADGTEPRVVTTRRIARPVATARAPLRCLNTDELLAELDVRAERGSYGSEDGRGKNDEGVHMV